MRVLKDSMTLTLPLAIIAASVMIGGCVLGSGCFDRYQIVTMGNTPMVWRLDKLTGHIVVCELAKNPNPFEQMDSTDNPANKLVIQCGNQ